jgi:hypothetical protein
MKGTVGVDGTDRERGNEKREGKVLGKAWQRDDLVADLVDHVGETKGHIGEAKEEVSENFVGERRGNEAMAPATGYVFDYREDEERKEERQPGTQLFLEQEILDRYEDDINREHRRREDEVLLYVVEPDAIGSAGDADGEREDEVDHGEGCHTQASGREPEDDPSRHGKKQKRNRERNKQQRAGEEVSEAGRHREAVSFRRLGKRG